MTQQLDLLTPPHRQAVAPPATRECGKRPDRYSGPPHPGDRLPAGLSRRADPPSSRAAGEEYAASVQRESDRRLVLDALKRHPGSTSRELAAAEGLDRHLVAKRLPDLEDDGAVRAVAHKICSSRHRREVDFNLAPCAIGRRPALRWWARPEVRR